MGMRGLPWLMAGAVEPRLPSCPLPTLRPTKCGLGFWELCEVAPGGVLATGVSLAQQVPDILAALRKRLSVGGLDVQLGVSLGPQTGFQSQLYQLP